MPKTLECRGQELTIYYQSNFSNSNATTLSSLLNTATQNFREKCIILFAFAMQIRKWSSGQLLGLLSANKPGHEGTGLLYYQTHLVLLYQEIQALPLPPWETMPLNCLIIQCTSALHQLIYAPTFYNINYGMKSLCSFCMFVS